MTMNHEFYIAHNYDPILLGGKSAFNDAVNS